MQQTNGQPQADQVPQQGGPQEGQGPPQQGQTNPPPPPLGAQASAAASASQSNQQPSTTQPNAGLNSQGLPTIPSSAASASTPAPTITFDPELFKQQILEFVNILSHR